MKTSGSRARKTPAFHGTRVTNRPASQRAAAVAAAQVSHSARMSTFSGAFFPAEFYFRAGSFTIQGSTPPGFVGISTASPARMRAA